MSTYAKPPSVDVGAMDTLLEPAESGEGYWVGAPCVHHHEETTYLAVRFRTPADRGKRLVIYTFDDGTLSEVTTITAAALGVVSVERAALVTNPQTGLLQCYIPVDRGGNDWVIQKLADAETPAGFDPETARTVLAPQPGTTDAGMVKDPVIETVGGRYYMYYAGADGLSEQAHLATSVDGETWSRHEQNPVLGRGYWHDHHTRVSAVVPAADAPVWLVFYGGSGVADRGRTWNLRTGTAVTPDLTQVTDTSPAGPQYAAPTADRKTGVETFAACRYLDILEAGDRWHIFAEVARSDEAFELRHTTVAPT